ncbi:HlyD family secretion protein [Bacilliculturomica massiliensis]|uniref:HlyD family secretion protein n=1 Tax=Bacilliculturomica massiliensis TaxID=1917867 RepID=UPI00102F3C0A|nr:HlyD family efflux transporter periplasmic adaptor subunit [Bacilliculturomica massiliensis]
MLRIKNIGKLIRTSAAGLCVLLLFSGCADSGTLTLTGVVEADVAAQVAEVSGKIKEFQAVLGQQVEQGDVIAVLDDEDERYTVEQLQAVRDQKQAALDGLQKGADGEEVIQADNQVAIEQSNVNSAQAACEKAEEDLARMEILWQEGAAAQADYDEAKERMVTARDAVNSARARLSTAEQQKKQLLQGPDDYEIGQAAAALRQAQSQLDQAAEKLNKYVIRAGCGGTVMSVNFSVGDVVSAGSNLMDISDRGGRYLVVYLPEEDLYAVSDGQKVGIAGKKENSEGEIAYIGLTAQYTPKDMQTQANKNKECVKLKIRLTTESSLKPGEKADALIPLE